MPPIYVLNVAAITKPHAVEHLTADPIAYNIEVAIITETHLKPNIVTNYLKSADIHCTAGIGRGVEAAG
jgi:hypothetical protein